MRHRNSNLGLEIMGLEFLNRSENLLSDYLATEVALLKFSHRFDNSDRQKFFRLINGESGNWREFLKIDSVKSS